MNIGGRLTLTSGVAVTESDVTGASAVYFTPAGAGLDLTQIYDGSALQERQFVETTLTLTNALHLASKNYPVFVAWSSGALFLGTGPAWSAGVPGGSDTVLIRGMPVNNGTITLKNGASSLSVATQQATYVGAIGLTAVNGLTEDSYVNRLIGNMYNTMPRPMARHDATGSWNYSTATYRAANANSANCITFVQSSGGRKAFARAQSLVANSTSTARRVACGIGVDSTSVDSATLTAFATVATEPFPVSAEYDGNPGVGRHSLYWLECGNGTDTQSWNGNTVQNNSGSATNYAPGIRGWVEL